MSAKTLRGLLAVHGQVLSKACCAKVLRIICTALAMYKLDGHFFLCEFRCFFHLLIFTAFASLFLFLSLICQGHVPLRHTDPLRTACCRIHQRHWQFLSLLWLLRLFRFLSLGWVFFSSLIWCSRCSCSIRWIFSCLLDLFLSLMHFLIFLLTSFICSLSSFSISLLFSMRTMISSSSSPILSFFFCDLIMSPLFVVFFAAASFFSRVLSVLFFSFVRGCRCCWVCFCISFCVLHCCCCLVLDRIVCSCGVCFSASFSLLHGCCCLVFTRLVCGYCGFSFLHDSPFEYTITLFEPGSFFRTHFFYWPDFWCSLLLSFSSIWCILFGSLSFSMLESQIEP